MNEQTLHGLVDVNLIMDFNKVMLNDLIKMAQMDNKRKESHSGMIMDQVGVKAS